MRSLFFLLYLPLFLCSSLIDLEQRAQDFVLETKKIDVPGFPLAFNPGIIRWQGRLLMSFRIIPDPKQSFNSEIGLIWLGENFQPMSEPQLLNLRDEFTNIPCRAEDARLISIGKKLYLVYDDNAELKISKGGFRVYIAELHYDGEHFLLGHQECLHTFEGENRWQREKNWVPFNYQGHLLLAYSLDPHLIFYPRLDGSGVCDTVSQMTDPLPWDWGKLRGGTPAQIVNGQYLAFFHSSKEMATLHSDGQKFTHYFMGAYTYSLDPPFAITAISGEPIVGKHFYKGTKYKPYWKPVRCVFPCGYVFNDKYIWVTYGRDDHEAWVAKIDKEKLLKSLH